MDKYELSIKEEKIKKHAEKKDYAAAVKIADTIDWSKIKNIKMLTLVSQVYEKAKNYTEAKNVLLIAYERVPMGRRMLYKLTELCVKEGNIEEAESYFEEFKKVAPGDTNQLLLAYQIETARSGDLDQMIAILEEYQKHEFEEKWLYELAFLYHRAGRVKECVKLCKDIILWFSVGVYVDRALNLKMQYEPLTPAEQEKLVNKKKFEARVRAVEREFEKREYRGIRGDEDEVLEQRRKREQIQEAAMTGEPATEEVTSEQEPPFAEEPAPDNVIPFAAVQSPAPEAEPPAERIADEIFDMQSDLAQAVLEAEKAPDPEEGQTQEEIFGQTREVVKETRKALEQERKQELGETEEFLNDVSAALAASAFAEETPVVLEREEEPPVLSEQEEGEEEEKEPPVLSEQEEEKEEEAPVLSEREEEKEPPVLSEQEEEKEEESPVLSEQEEEKKEESPAALEQEGKKPENESAAPKQEMEASGQETADYGEFEIICVVVEAEPGAERIPLAVEKLKKTHEVLGSKAGQVAKISGEKLSARGVRATFKRLAGRDLIVDNAAELSHEAVAELTEEIKQPRMSMVLLLVDTSQNLDELLVANPDLDQLCVYLEEGGRMEIDDFVDCACKYAKEEECVIEEMAKLAIFAIAERLQNDGATLTKEAAKELVDEAIDRAEHRGIKGLFGSKYDKEGYLILKEQFFKNL